MKTRNRLICTKIVALLLIIALMVPCNASAAAMEPAAPYASNYLTLYSAYVYVTASGEAQVWFEVMGTDDMDEIGTLSIMLYESSDGTNWKLVKTFLHNKTPGMLFTNDYYVSSHVSWPYGSTNKQYKAYVGVWAGKDGDGDNRYFWAYQPKTEPQKETASR